MGRYGSTDDIAKMAIFLASDATAYMTGEIIRVDGGQVLTGGMMIDPESLVA
jgi:3-oxoacyl-[acyl-carrier protein] reductase